MAHFPDLDAIRRSRLKKSTLFEMETRPNWRPCRSRIHAPGRRRCGRRSRWRVPMKDRDIFDLLGFD
jgi:light-independent protochlorophyllide reductase subunit L